MKKNQELIDKNLHYSRLRDKLVKLIEDNYTDRLDTHSHIDPIIELYREIICIGGEEIFDELMTDGSYSLDHKRVELMTIAFSIKAIDAALEHVSCVIFNEDLIIYFGLDKDYVRVFQLEDIMRIIIEYFCYRIDNDNYLNKYEGEQRYFKDYNKKCNFKEDFNPQEMCFILEDLSKLYYEIEKMKEG